MTSNTQGDTPPIQPDELEQILFEHGFCFGITAKNRREGIAAIELWHQQALERERLEGQIELLQRIMATERFKRSEECISCLGTSVVIDELSTLTNKDKDNE